MNSCAVVNHSAASQRPAPLDRKAPGETIPVEHDLSDDVDCADSGVTITVSSWAIHADDDDATLTLASDTVTGLETRVMVSGGTDGSFYRLVNTVTTSDGRTIQRTSDLPVCETEARAA